MLGGMDSRSRSALVTHFEGDQNLVHPSALFAPPPADTLALLKHLDQKTAPQDEVETMEDGAASFTTDDVGEEAGTSDRADTAEEAATLDDHETAYGIAAE